MPGAPQMIIGTLPQSEAIKAAKLKVELGLGWPSLPFGDQGLLLLEFSSLGTTQATHLDRPTSVSLG